MNVRHRILTLGIACVVGVLVSAPQFVHMFDARYQGVPLQFNSDELSYQTHLEEALLGRYAQAGKGITRSGETDPSFHLSIIEDIEGFLWGWTGLHAPHVFWLMDFIAPFLFMVVLVPLLRSFGLSARESLMGAMLFAMLQLANLNRPINQRESVLLAISAILCCQYSRIRGIVWSILGGLLLGILVGTNVWAWMIAWCMWGVLLVLLTLNHEWSDVRGLVKTGIVGVAAATPFVWQIFSIRSHPAYEDTVLRSGIIHWRIPESLPWSVCFAMMAVCTLLHWWCRGRAKADLSIVALITSAFIVFNQQLVHGYTLMFRAHFLFFLTIAAIVILLWNICKLRAEKSLLVMISTVAAIAIIGALGFENRKVIAQWRIDDGDFHTQHFATLLPMLDTLPRSIILSDPDASVFISASTKHDVVFTGYLQHTLITHRDLAHAFCLTQLPIPPKDRHFLDRNLLVLANAVGSQLDLAKRSALRALDLQLADEACRAVDRDPQKAIEEARIDYVLWDEAHQPLWDLSRMRTPLQRIGEGEGWSLWKVLSTGFDMSMTRTLYSIHEMEREQGKRLRHHWRT